MVQGDREMSKDNRSLARFALRGLPPLPAGVPRVLSHHLDEVSAPFARRRIERDLTLALQGREAGAVGEQLGMRS